MSTSVIWIRALDMLTKSEHRTGLNRSQETKSGLKLIASLKKWIKKKASEVPKYLTGKEKNNG